MCVHYRDYDDIIFIRDKFEIDSLYEQNRDVKGSLWGQTKIICSYCKGFYLKNKNLLLGGEKLQNAINRK